MTKTEFDSIVERKAEAQFSQSFKALKEHFDTFFKYNNDFKINDGWWEISNSYEKHILANKETYLKNIKTRIINQTFDKIDQLDYLFNTPRSE